MTPVRPGRRRAPSGWSCAVLAAAAMITATDTAAQARAPGEADPGVRPTRLIDRPEIRVSRVELQGGAVRAVHAHDDVEYHVWVPLEGRFEITIAPDGPVAAEPGQAFFMTRGTQHGFRNLGSETGAVMEIFVKQSSVSASRVAAEELAQVMALIRRRGGRP